MSSDNTRVKALDGMRAISILLVLAAHLLPLKIGAHSYNDSVGMLGMALFFSLSGYLISLQMTSGKSAADFLIRRLMRVAPAAWLCILLVAAFSPISAGEFLRHVLFIANMPPQTLRDPLDHFWSLGVEVQFYVAAAIMMALGLALALMTRAIFVFLILVTVLRAYGGVNGTSYTWYRIDDILAGAALGLLLQSHWAEKLRGYLSSARVLWLIVPLLVVSAYIPAGDSAPNFMSLARPYLAAVLLGVILCLKSGAVYDLLSGKRLAYVASISYALYVWHKPLASTWLGTGDLLEKYAKRPLLFAVLLVVAHLSTFYFEKYFNERARKATQPAH